jgi:hypothetical protein
MGRPLTIDPANAADRRRFFLDRAYRRPTYGCGRDLRGLMDKPRVNDAAVPVCDGVPYMLVGAHAAAVCAPERATQSVDIVIPHGKFARVNDLLLAEDWHTIADLDFRGSTLGLFGKAFSKTSFQDINVITSYAPWLGSAFEAPEIVNSFSRRVMPLPYLVLMMIDSARALDQGDLSRMLGRLDKAQVDEVVDVVERAYGADFSLDIRQYAEIGSWEYLTEAPKRPLDTNGR